MAAYHGWVDCSDGRSYYVPPSREWLRRRWLRWHSLVARVRAIEKQLATIEGKLEGK
jgi:hypothetical protein